MNAAVAAPISEDLLRRFDVSGPRYTSYPTADRFVEAFSVEDYTQALKQRRAGGVMMRARRITLSPAATGVARARPASR